jgi:hypothetical protein
MLQSRVGNHEILLAVADPAIVFAPWYCRANGRTYRLSPAKDKMWNLYRVSSTSDDEEGALIGKDQSRRDASQVVKDTRGNRPNAEVSRAAIF